MDIHRCRFVPYPPSAINALAFSHPSSLTSPGKGPSSLRLAIGRANGDIEIWNPLRGAWYQESIFRGGRNRSIEGLVWTQDPEDVDKRGNTVPGRLRLFSIGYSTAVTEWDLGRGKPLRHSAGNYGEIWCMAAQPKGQLLKKPGRAAEDQVHEEDTQIQNIAVGCADGAIIWLNTTDDDLRFTRILARSSKKKSRVLSLAFQNRHTIIAGHADSTIRVFDVRNGQQIRNMTLGAGPKHGPKETLVWSVKCLLDGTIVSGDSTGTLCFWDGKHYALLQRIKSHAADILDIAVSADGQSVFSGGMDRRTVLYRSIGTGRQDHRWAKITHQRMHQNDVKAMAAFETKGLSILVSGGLDTMPIIVPIQEFGREYHRTLASLPQEPNVRSVPKNRFLVSWWDREIRIWEILKPPNRQVDNDPFSQADGSLGRRLAAKIAVQGDESITSVDVSSDGKKLAVATMAGIKIFNLRLKSGILKVQKSDLTQTSADLSNREAKIVQFSPNTKWLASIGSDNSIFLHRKSETNEEKAFPVFMSASVELKRLHRDASNPKAKDASLGSYDRSINRLTFSADSRILAVSDLSGFLDTWVIEGQENLEQSNDQEPNSEYAAERSDPSDEEDSEEGDSRTVLYGERWIRNPAASLLTKMPAAPLILTFRPLTTQAIRGLTNGVVGVHPTRHNPHPHSHDLPNGEDRLFVLTAGNQIYEFNVLSGKLTDWSRRNPTSSLPREFRDLRDRAKSAVWDVKGHNERIWLYGASWLWMFDLSRDLPPPDDDEQRDVPTMTGTSKDISLKRKREDSNNDEESTANRPRIDTGAGSRIPAAKLAIGIGRKMRIIDGVDGAVDQVVNLDTEPDPVSDDEEELGPGYVPANNNNELDRALIRLRRSGNIEQPNGHMDPQIDDDGDDGDDNDDNNHPTDTSTSDQDQTHLPLTKKKKTKTAGDPPTHWHTYKYRPILGIVPLGRETDDDDDDEEELKAKEADKSSSTSSSFPSSSSSSSSGLEVAVVERPLFDVDLPPRFFGDQEWGGGLS